jgi:uncharacterized protein YjbI with pentapeptide repeats
MTALTRATFLAETRQFGDRSRYTQFSGRNFRNCDLSRLDLRTLNLRDTWLLAARLDRSDLTYTDLRGANLSWASVRGADLSGALIDPATTWHGAIADPDTHWPAGFSPAGSGVTVQFTRPGSVEALPVRVEPTALPTLLGL